MNILLFNAHWNNRGDEAALRAVIDAIKGFSGISKDISISILFKDRGPVTQFPYEDIRYVSSRFLIEEADFLATIDGLKANNGDSEIDKTIELVRSADIAVYAPGGAVISDEFWWQKQLEYLLPIAVAEKCGIPIVFAAPSFGPFHETHKIRTEILKRAGVVCVREKISKDYLHNIGIDNVVTTIDSSYLDTFDFDRENKRFENDLSLKSFFSSNAKVVAITYTDLAWNVRYASDREMPKRIQGEMALFIEYLTSNNYSVLLIPQLFGNQNDYDVLKGFQLENCFILSDTFDTYFQQYVVSKCYAVVGMRYHSNIFAAKSEIPFLPIVYEEKMQGFLDILGIADYGVDVKDLKFKILKEAFDKIVSNYDTYKSLLHEKHNKLIALAGETRNILRKKICEAASKNKGECC